jgi:C4-dicarboxylate-specific signal transduction histidine kinase
MERPGKNYAIGSWAWNVRTGALFWSAEHFRICGLEPGSVQPSCELFFAMVHPDDRSRVAQSFEQAVRERAEYQCRYRIVHPDRSVREVDTVGRFVLDENGEPIQFVGTIIDLTESTRAADDLRRAGEAFRTAQADLARMSRIAVLGELSASLAHELLQPLAAIVANNDASLRWQRCSPPNLVQSALAAERIRRDALRASAMVGRIRAFLQKAAPERTWVHLGEAVQEVIGMLTAEFQRHHVEVQAALPTSLPPVLVQHVELQQVLVNLITIAMESLTHVPESRHRLLSVECSRSHVNGADVVGVRIQDAGPAIDEADRTRFFGESSGTRSEGLGLALAISQSIVRRHGGELSAQNAAEGPRFDFYIPLG